MQNNKLNKDLTKVFILILLIITIALSIVTYINWSYLTGYILGSIFAACSFWLNEFLYGKLLSKRKKFQNMFFISYLKFIIWATVFIGIVIAILFINKTYNQRSTELMDWCSGVFDIFLFIVGSSMQFITIIVYHIGESIMKWNKNKKQRKE